MTKPKLTANKGAAETRHEILRKMKELDAKTYGPRGDYLERAWETLRTYIKGMAKRASKKLGGLGRK